MAEDSNTPEIAVDSALEAAGQGPGFFRGYEAVVAECLALVGLGLAGDLFIGSGNRFADGAQLDS